MRQRKTNNSDETLDRLLSKLDKRAQAEGIEFEPEEYSLDWYRADWINRKQVFIEREIKVRDAFQNNKLVPFVLNDAQKTLLAASNDASLDNSIENFTLKCRRLGISTYYCADYLADAIIESGHHVRIVAQDPMTLAALFRVVKTMYANLRPEIKPASKYNSKNSLEFNDEEKGVVESKFSVSTVSPGEEEKGRGDTITRLHLTEIPFWKGDAEMAATALCDATAGGKISGESTAKGVGDWFHRKYTQGKARVGGIRSHFFEWFWNTNYQIDGASFEIHEGVIFLLLKNQNFDLLSDEEKLESRISIYDEKEQRDNNLPMQSEQTCAMKIAEHLVRIGEIENELEWLCDAVARRLAWRRQQIAKRGEKKFRVEYPENDVDPFAQTGGSIFDQSYTQQVYEPREPEAGHSYLVICDPSLGIEGSGDPAIVTVLDRNTNEQVYSWRGWEKQDAQGARCCEMSDKYFGAEIAVESNMGEGVILEVENRGYGHRLYRYIDVQTQRDVEDGRITMMQAIERARPGLPMTDKVKRTAITMLEKAWREGDFKPCSQNVCDEAVVFVQNGNKMEAKSGYHDDEIMACAIGQFIIETDYIGKAGFASSGQKLGSARMGRF